MCGLFGFSNYSGEKIKGLSTLTNSLAEQSAIRGTDATGIAFVGSGGINILKESKSAYRLNFNHSDEICSLIGHTRHSTQGSEKKNYNNHPFLGQCINTKFALAHNGVLLNDKELRKSLRLPRTKIETDSYIAVQVIESKNDLNFESIRYMAEKIDGSFSFSLLDDNNNIYIVKGDSPLSILHFPKLKIYVYASTDEILFKSIVDTSLFGALRKGEYEEVKIADGDILKIFSNGELKTERFEYTSSCTKKWYEYGMFTYKSPVVNSSEYLDDLKSFASYQGFSPEDIDKLVFEDGLSLEEVEEYLYGFGY